MRLATVLLLLALVRPTPAQGQEQRYSFRLTAVPLEEALSQVAATSGIDLAFTSDLVAGKRVSCGILDALVGEVLQCVLRGTGLDFIVLSSGTYVLIKAAQLPDALGTLVGIVVDADSGAPLPYAHVFLSGPDIGAVSNESGRFVFGDVLDGDYRVSASYVGYEDRAMLVSVRKAERAEAALRLNPAPVRIEPVVVDGMRRRIPFGTESGLNEEPIPQVDPLERVGLLAGVRTGDALVGVHLQGGDSGEHQFRLDGATVFVPLKLGGLISPFSPLALDRIVIRRAGFGVDGGSHLSGVLEASHEAAPSDEVLHVQWDPVAFSGRVSQNVRWKGRDLALMASGRRSLLQRWSPAVFLDQIEVWSQPDDFLFEAPFLQFWEQDFEDLLAEFEEEGDSEDKELFEVKSESFDIGFSDFHASVRMRPSPVSSLHVSGYRGRSDMGRSLEFGGETDLLPVDFSELGDSFGREAYRWNNDVLQSRFESVLGSRALFSIQGWWSRYLLEHPIDYELALIDLTDEEVLSEDESADDVLDWLSDLETEDRNRMEERGAAARFDLAAGARQTLAGGVEIVQTVSEFQVTLPRFAEGWDLQQLFLASDPAMRAAAFVTHRIELGRRTVVETGARLTALAHYDDIFVEPRISVRHDARLRGSRQLAVQVGGGLYRQFSQQLDVGTYQFNALVPGYRVWLPLRGENRPPKAWHLVGDILFRPGPALSLGIEAYHKAIPHTLVVDYASIIQGEDSDPEAASGFLRSANGAASGVSIRASLDRARTRLDARYDHARSLRRIAGRFEGALIATPWNVPHRFVLFGQQVLSGAWSLSAKLVVEEGRSWGYRRAYYDFFGVHPDLAEVAGINFRRPDTHRLPTLAQLDLGVGFRKGLDRGSLSVHLQLVNALGRENISGWSLADDTDWSEENLESWRSGTQPFQLQTARKARTMIPRQPLLTVTFSW
ncbi:MAG: carboxypeptidase-like regulatory domain-containing protein [Rhodothermales bacterium]|nr:carboxypeptidase-like regulatory domain-containing protein [Rhodothermales bacterium]